MTRTTSEQQQAFSWLRRQMAWEGCLTTLHSGERAPRTGDRDLDRVHWALTDDVV